jgi:hypothetical protein
VNVTQPHDPQAERDEPRRLLDTSPSASTPFLLELARRQAARRAPRDLLAQQGRDGFVAPAPLDLRTLHAFDGLALAATHEFEALQLAPVAPLGSCSVLAPTSQDRTLSVARGLEVVSDPTNVLALECARRLARAPAVEVRLATIHQVLRAQALPPRAGHTRHFRLLALAEAGPGRAEDGFEVDAFARHVAVLERILATSSSLGCRVPPRRACLLHDAQRAVTAERLRTRLARDLPGLELASEPLESRYYAGLRVLLTVDAAGESMALADTGLFDWVARLTSNARQRFVASGLGLQLLPLLFRGPPR